MNLRQIFVFIVVFTLSFVGSSQDKFHLSNNAKKSSISFQMINNLIVLPIHVNGEKLVFLVDTGIDKTLLFNLSNVDSITLIGIEKIKLRGLGEGGEIEAIKSERNTIQFKGVVGKNQTIYALLDSQFDLSAKMGIDIHGIIGGDLFDDFIVKVNYSSRKITFYDPLYYEHKKCDKCLTMPLEFYRRKPLLKVTVENELDEKFDVKLLIDCGGSDALWLFKGTHPSIQISNNSFKDVLGRGLGGQIFGKRGILNKLSIGEFVFDNISVSYPDSTSIVSVQNNKERNGTIGSEILRRFHIIYDYPNKKITLKKNTSNYDDIFTYNKSGIELVYGGDVLVPEKKQLIDNSHRNNPSENSITEIIYRYSLSFRPSYQIAFLREGSSAKIAGLRVGDIFLEVNGKTAYNYTLEEIIYILSGRINKKIKLLIDRDGKQLKYSFTLQDLLQKDIK